MLKLEIKMDEAKILAEQKYRVESIYQALKQAFSRYKLNLDEGRRWDDVLYRQWKPKRLRCVWQYYHVFEGKSMVYGLCNQVGMVQQR